MPISGVFEREIFNIFAASFLLVVWCCLSELFRRIDIGESNGAKFGVPINFLFDESNLPITTFLDGEADF